MELTNMAVIKPLLSKNGIVLTKARGQNFIINPSVCPRMADECGAGENDGVLEIGPGIGVLTAELAKRAGKVVSIELDSGLVPILSETLAEFDNVKIIEGDALKLNLAEIIKTEFGGKRVFVCANLPYNISTNLVMTLLESNLGFESMTVMVQKEFAERITAPVGSRKSGAITVGAAFLAKSEILFGVSAGSFFPAPKVDSTVMKLTPYKTPPVEVINRDLFMKTVNAGFCQRRKTLQNSLSAVLAVKKSDVAEILESMGKSPLARIEELDLAELALLSDRLCEVL